MSNLQPNTAISPLMNPETTLEYSLERKDSLNKVQCYNNSGTIIPANSCLEPTTNDTNGITYVVKPTADNLKYFLISPSHPIQVGEYFDAYKSAYVTITGDAPSIQDTLGSVEDSWSMKKNNTGAVTHRVWEGLAYANPFSGDTGGGGDNPYYTAQIADIFLTDTSVDFGTEYFGGTEEYPYFNILDESGSKIQFKDLTPILYSKIVFGDNLKDEEGGDNGLLIGFELKENNFDEWENVIVRVKVRLEIEDENGNKYNYVSIVSENTGEISGESKATDIAIPVLGANSHLKIFANAQSIFYLASIDTVDDYAPFLRGRFLIDYEIGRDDFGNGLSLGNLEGDMPTPPIPLTEITLRNVSDTPADKGILFDFDVYVVTYNYDSYVDNLDGTYTFTLAEEYESIELTDGANILYSRFADVTTNLLYNYDYGNGSLPATRVTYFSFLNDNFEIV